MSFTLLKKTANLLFNQGIAGLLFQQISNNLYGRFCCVCLGCGAFCQQIGVILAGGVEQVKRCCEKRRVQGFEFYSQFRYLYIKRRNRNLRRDT